MLEINIFNEVSGEGVGIKDNDEKKAYRTFRKEVKQSYTSFPGEIKVEVKGFDAKNYQAKAEGYIQKLKDGKIK